MLLLRKKKKFCCVRFDCKRPKYEIHALQHIIILRNAVFCFYENKITHEIKELIET